MEKIIGLVLVLVYGAWFFTGQAVDTDADNQVVQEVRLMDDAKTEVRLTHTQMYNTVKTVAENEGWNTTKFKINALIAEKTSENDSVSVTVTFSKFEFSISPENSDLQNAINSALGL